MFPLLQNVGHAAEPERLVKILLNKLLFLYSAVNFRYYKSDN